MLKVVQDDDGHPVTESYEDTKKPITESDIVTEMKLLINKMIQGLELLEKLNKE